MTSTGRMISYGRPARHDRLRRSLKRNDADEESFFSLRCRSLPPRSRSSLSRGESWSSRQSLELNGTGKSVKLGRIKVGVRIRPAFRYEVLQWSGGRAGYRPAVTVYRPSLVDIRMPNGRQRRFPFDFTFDENNQQREVYESGFGEMQRGPTISLAAPVVESCMNDGFNGLIMAYGQTASGKSYTMGTLPVAPDIAASGKDSTMPIFLRTTDSLAGGAVSNDQFDGICEPRRDYSASVEPGIIPRAISRVFELVGSASQERTGQAAVKLSLLQIYNGVVQDLLTPTSALVGKVRGLHIREDPSTGFFVEGLREYVVRSQQEARLPEYYHINTRSPHFTQEYQGVFRWYYREKRSERQRETGYINGSLSALGNVVEALGHAEINRPHIPFRDSKLTRILADSLGGNANTALIATVGPAPQNQAESFSTLVFASRCMRVTSAPVRHDEQDRAEITLRLQTQLSSMQREFCRREALQRSRYETVITRLAEEVEFFRKNLITAKTSRAQNTPRTPSPEPHPMSLKACARDAAVSDTVYAALSTAGQRQQTPSVGVDGGAESSETPERERWAVNCEDDATLEPASQRRLAENDGVSRAGIAGDTDGALLGPRESEAWIVVDEAVRMMVSIERKGGEVTRKARDQQASSLMNSPAVAAGPKPVQIPSAKHDVHGGTYPREREDAIQCLETHRDACERQWEEVEETFSRLVTHNKSLAQKLRMEMLERRRQEEKAWRITGALRNLLSDGVEAEPAASVGDDGVVPGDDGVVSSSITWPSDFKSPDPWSDLVSNKEAVSRKHVPDTRERDYDHRVEPIPSDARGDTGLQR